MEGPRGARKQDIPALRALTDRAGFLDAEAGLHGELVLGLFEHVFRRAVAVVLEHLRGLLGDAADDDRRVGHRTSTGPACGRGG